MRNEVPDPMHTDVVGLEDARAMIHAHNGSRAQADDRASDARPTHAVDFLDSHRGQPSVGAKTPSLPAVRAVNCVWHHVAEHQGTQIAHDLPTDTKASMMSKDTRRLPLSDKLAVLKELREFLLLTPEEYRRLIGHVVKGYYAAAPSKTGDDTKVAGSR